MLRDLLDFLKSHKLILIVPLLVLILALFLIGIAFRSEPGVLQLYSAAPAAPFTGREA